MLDFGSESFIDLTKLSYSFSKLMSSILAKPLIPPITNTLVGCNAITWLIRILIPFKSSLGYPRLQIRLSGNDFSNAPP